MTSTEYLFGHKKEHYGPHLELIARRRLKDAKLLRAKLQERVTYDPKSQNRFQRWLMLRLRKVNEAIIVWEKILEEE